MGGAGQSHGGITGEGAGAVGDGATGEGDALGVGDGDGDGDGRGGGGGAFLLEGGCLGLIELMAHHCCPELLALAYSCTLLSVHVAEPPRYFRQPAPRE